MNQTIPEYWAMPEPQHSDQGKPITWRGLAWTMFTLPFLPKRFGPRIVNSTWIKAVVVAFISMFFSTSIGLIGTILYYAGKQTPYTQIASKYIYREPVSEPPTNPVDDLLSAGARCTNQAYRLSSSQQSHLITLVAVSGSCVFFTPVTSVILMPLIGGPLRLKQRYLHSSRSQLWASIILIPASILFSISLSFDKSLSPFSPAVTYSLILTGGIHVFWFLILVTKLGAAYRVKNREHSILESRPRCCECGYIITGIQVDGNCPECGCAVSQSIPKYRNHPAWATASFLRKPLAYCTTTAAIMRDTGFFKNLSIHDGRSPALSFTAATAVVFGFLAMLALAPPIANELKKSQLVYGSFAPEAHTELYIVLLESAVVASLAFLCIILIRTHMASRLCYRDPRPRLTVIAYSSVNWLFLPISLSLITYTQLRFIRLKRTLFREWRGFSV